MPLLTGRSRASIRPRRATVGPLAPLLPLLSLLAACTPSVPTREELHRAPPPATVRTVSFHGWRRCQRLGNGIVRVTAVPQAGGRVLEYALGPYNHLLIGRRSLGATLKTAGERRYIHFGGHFTQLHPERRWQELQSSYPAGLLMGAYDAEAEADGAAAAVTLTSPMDLATGTRIARRFELRPASSHLRVTVTVTNQRLVPQQWGIHDVLQLKGHPAASGVLSGAEAPPRGLDLYVPLNPRSAFPGGVQFVERGPLPPGSPAGQWDTDRHPGILTLHYRGLLAKAVVDPSLPWVAFADRTTGHVFVQLCRAPRKAILTSGGAATPYPTIELQSYAAVATLKPGESTTLVQDWFATRCPTPVVDVTHAGVVSSPLSLLRGDDGATWVAGTFGLFHVGTAAVVVRDAAGKELATLDCGPVDPLAPLELNRPIRLPAGAAEVALEVRDLEGALVGHLGKILFPS